MGPSRTVEAALSSTPFPAPVCTLAVHEADAPASGPGAPRCVSLYDLEKRHILSTLEQCNQNRTQAAKLLEISVRTLRNKLHEYGAAANAGEAEAEDVGAPSLVVEKSA